MLKTGIVSVTFRNKPIGEVIELAARASLSCIEVGSDIHAPKDRLEECRSIARAAKEKNFEIISYGSYYCLGEYISPVEEFEGYLDAADVLGAKNIRIWAGKCGKSSSLTIDSEQRAALTCEAQTVSRLALKRQKTISFEYHPGTLTDQPDSARRLIEDIACENVSLYWQPDQNRDVEYNCSALKTVLPFVSNLHVFAWDARSGSCVRYRLREHEAAWQSYLGILAADRREHTLLLEFVKDDSEVNFAEDARVLVEWSRKLGG